MKIYVPLKLTAILKLMPFSAKICIVLIMLTSYTARAQYKLKVWDTRDGLSNNWISDITQDDQGYIWLATQYGLNRFDGYSFVSFTNNPDDDNSPIANWIKRIERKSENELWLGVEYGGLDLYNTEEKAFSRHTITRAKDTITSVNQLLSSENHQLYIATNSGVFRKNSSEKKVTKIFDGKVIDLGENSKGQIFFLSDVALYLYDTKNDSYNRVIDTLEKI